MSTVNFGEQVHFLSAVHSKFLSCSRSGELAADRKKAGDYEIFTIESANGSTGPIQFNDQIFLKSAHGKFVTVPPMGTLLANRQTPQETEMFVIYDVQDYNSTQRITSNNQILLQAHTGKVLAAEPDGKVSADRAQWEYSWDLFYIQRAHEENNTATFEQIHQHHGGELGMNEQFANLTINQDNIPDITQNSTVFEDDFFQQITEIKPQPQPQQPLTEIKPQPQPQQPLQSKQQGSFHGTNQQVMQPKTAPIMQPTPYNNQHNQYGQQQQYVQPIYPYAQQPQQQQQQQPQQQQQQQQVWTSYVDSFDDFMNNVPQKKQVKPEPEPKTRPEPRNEPKEVRQPPKKRETVPERTEPLRTQLPARTTTNGKRKFQIQIASRNLNATSLKIAIMDEENRTAYKVGIQFSTGTQIFDGENKKAGSITREPMHIHNTFAVFNSKGKQLAQCKERFKLTERKFNYKRFDNGDVLKMVGDFNSGFRVTRNEKKVIAALKPLRGGGYYAVMDTDGTTETYHTLNLALIMIETQYWTSSSLGL
jgi:uncharacterized protein YxjI